MMWQRTTVIALVVISCSAANAALRNRYSFTSDASDSVGGANGTVVDPGTPTAVFAGGKLDLSANVGESSNGIVGDAYVNLPNGVVSAAANAGTAGQVTIEIWAQSSTNRNWAALFTAGNSNGGEDQASGGNNTDYVQLIPQNGANGRIRATTHAAGNGAEGFVDFGSAMSTTQTTHFVSVINQNGGLPGTITMYIDGALIGSAPVATGLNVGAMNDVNVWLGRSQWPDSIFDGSYDEVRIYDTALSAAAIATDFQLGPNGVVPEPGCLSLLATGIASVFVARRKTA
jgi:hypothetical protein